MFVDTSRVAVTVDGPIDPKDVTPDMNVMFIRKKMDLGTQQAVIGTATKLSPPRQETETEEARDTDIAIDVGAWQIALMLHNVLAWSGPAFAGIPCGPKNIKRLDPDEPLVQRVRAEIAERNQSAASPKPSASATSAGG